MQPIVSVVGVLVPVLQYFCDPLAPCAQPLRVEQRRLLQSTRPRDAVVLPLPSPLRPDALD